jgi:DNA polymerase-3 subunit alpha
MSFSTGETVGFFSMKVLECKIYKELKPTVFPDCHECLVSSRTVYSEFRQAKNGEEEIIYDLDACEELLKDTYGITVYQEQVMLLSQNWQIL